MDTVIVQVYDADGNEYNVMSDYLSQFLANGFTRQKPEAAVPAPKAVQPAKG